MSISLITAPVKTVADVKTSYLFGAFNPIIWKWQRSDGTFSVVANDGGHCKLTIDNSTDLIVNDYIWIKFAAVYTDGYYKITTVADSTHITIDLDYASTTTGTYVSIVGRKPNYYLRITVDVQNYSEQIVIDGYPDKTGLIIVDVSSFLKSLIDFKLSNSYFDYRNIHPDFDKANWYSLHYQEKWDGSSEALNAYAYVPKYCGASMQLQEENAPSMYDYDICLLNIALAKFMTRAVKGRYHRDRPYDLTIGACIELSSYEITYSYFMYDVNGVFIAYYSQSHIIDSDDDDPIIRCLIDVDDWGGSFNSSTVMFMVHVSSAISISGISNGWKGSDSFEIFSWNGSTKLLSFTNSSGSGYCESATLGAFEQGETVLIRFMNGFISNDVTIFLQDLADSSVISNVYVCPGFGPSQNLLVELTLTEDCAQVGLVIGKSSGGFAGSCYVYAEKPLSEEYEIDYVDDCVDNEIYLGWFNTLGGFDYWRFGHHQEESIEVSKQIYERYIDNLETDESIQGVLDTEAVEVYKVGANNLTSEQILLLKDLLYSPKVAMLVNPDDWQSDGAKWKEVIVRANTFLIRKNDETTFSIEFEIELPKILINY